MKREKTKVTRTKRRITPKHGSESRPNSDLPPNENIQKFADEVYGDTKIPHRKRLKPQPTV